MKYITLKEFIESKDRNSLFHYNYYDKIKKELDKIFNPSERNICTSCGGDFDFLEYINLSIDVDRTQYKISSCGEGKIHEYDEFIIVGL